MKPVLTKLAMGGMAFSLTLCLFGKRECDFLNEKSNISAGTIVLNSCMDCKPSNKACDKITDADDKIPGLPCTAKEDGDVLYSCSGKAGSQPTDPPKHVNGKLEWESTTKSEKVEPRPEQNCVPTRVVKCKKEEGKPVYRWNALTPKDEEWQSVNCGKIPACNATGRYLNHPDCKKPKDGDGEGGE